MTEPKEYRLYKIKQWLNAFKLEGDTESFEKIAIDLDYCMDMKTDGLLGYEVGVNEIQEIQLRLMELSSFNSFDGERAANLLRENRHLWKAVIFDRMNLIKLRDLSEDYWNVDTMYITPTTGKKDKRLYTMINGLGPDEIHWIDGDHAGDQLGQWGLSAANVYIRAWWD